MRQSLAVNLILCSFSIKSPVKFVEKEILNIKKAYSLEINLFKKHWLQYISYICLLIAYSSLLESICYLPKWTQSLYRWTLLLLTYVNVWSILYFPMLLSFQKISYPKGSLFCSYSSNICKKNTLIGIYKLAWLVNVK